MPIPFKRTIKEAKSKGPIKTVNMLCALSLRRLIKKIKRLPNEEKRLPKEEIIEVHESEMIVQPNKGTIHTELFLYKKREPRCTDYLFYSGIIKKGDVVLDIGANIGYYVLAEAKIVGEKGEVYAVEPVSTNFKLLNRNVQLNNLTNVSTFQYAFGDRNIETEIFVSEKVNLCAVNKDAVSGEIIAVQPVTMRTVDEFVKDKKTPKLIRMDVEGYEYEILKGMSSTLKSDVKILMELHPLPQCLTPKKLDEVYEILEQNNFIAKFVVFENKVIENRLVEFFLKNAGEKLPITASNVSFQELKRLVRENHLLACPNIFFEKEVK